MISQFFRLLQNEITKAARRPFPRFGIFLMGLVAVIIYFIAGQISAAATSNAWGYVGFSMQMIFTDIGQICIVAFSARLLAEETGTGTIRAALAAPVHRWEFYLAKAAAGLLYMIILSTAALLCSMALAAIHFQFDAVGDSAGVVYTRSQAMHGLVAAYLLSWIPLSALVMYGLLISTLIRNTGAAVSVGISSLFLIEFTKHLAGLDPYIFTRYIDYSWLNLLQIAQGMDYQWRPEIWNMIGLSVISAAVMFFAGLIVFVRQDLNH